MGGMEFHADIREFELVEKKIGQWSKETGGNVHKAVEVSARNVKDGAREFLYSQMNGNRGKSQIKHLPGAIGYKMLPVPPAIGSEAEIEPQDGKKQAQLGAIIEGGTPTSPPRPFMEPALKYEEKGFLEGMEKALMQGWDG